MAAEDLHYYDDAKERVMVYPGARCPLPDDTMAVLLLIKNLPCMRVPHTVGCWLESALWANCQLFDQDSQGFGLANRVVVAGREKAN